MEITNVFDLQISEFAFLSKAIFHFHFMKVWGFRGISPNKRLRCTNLSIVHRQSMLATPQIKDLKNGVNPPEKKQEMKSLQEENYERKIKNFSYVCKSK